jgi:hypothetical protein
MFAPIYKHVVILRQAVLQKEVDFLLEVGCSAGYGYIDEIMTLDSGQRLAERGFDPAKLQYTVTATNGASAADPLAPVPRGQGIRLKISYPYEQLFDIDRLIGIVPPVSSGRISAEGMKMSEYVP